MTWPEIKNELDRTSHESDSVSTLLNSPRFWESDESAIFGTASFLYETGKSAECLRVIDAVRLRGRALSPKTDMEFRYLRGDALHGIEDYPEAVAVYGEIIAIEPSDIAFGNRALAQWELGNYQEALNDYLEAVRLNPKNTVAHRGVGEMLIKLDRPHDAVRYLTVAVNLDSEYAAAYTALGVAYYNSGDWLKSYQALKTAVELAPDDRIAAKGIAKIERHFEMEN